MCYYLNVCFQGQRVKQNTILDVGISNDNVNIVRPMEVSSTEQELNCRRNVGIVGTNTFWVVSKV